MSRFAKIAPFALFAALAASASWAQASGAATTAQGFTVQSFIAEVSLFLPPDLLRAAAGARAAGAPGANPMGNAASNAGPAQNRPQLQFTRDPKLYLTKAQVDRLEPIATSLKDNPMPSPSKAKQTQAELDAILSPAQRTEFADFQKAMAKFRADMQKQRSASGQQPPDFRTMTDQQRQAYIDSLPPEQRQRFQNRAGQQGGGMSQLQRRQRLAETFIKALEEYRKTMP
jgi:hypothetical protein